MTESQHWQRLRKYLKGRVYSWKINASYAMGVPDCWLSGTEKDLWIENKRIQNDAEPPALLDLTDDKKYLTALQQKWLVDRYEEGRRVGVIVFSKIGHIYLPGLSWQKPIPKLEFMSAAKSHKDLAEQLIEFLGEEA